MLMRAHRKFGNKENFCEGEWWHRLWILNLLGTVLTVLTYMDKFYVIISNLLVSFIPLVL